MAEGGQGSDGHKHDAQGRDHADSVHNRAEPYGSVPPEDGACRQGGTLRRRLHEHIHIRFQSGGYKMGAQQGASAASSDCRGRGVLDNIPHAYILSGAARQHARQPYGGADNEGT